VQISDKTTMRYLRIFEADHELTMIRKESPRLPDVLAHAANPPAAFRESL
jgi:hypothetical protein